MRHVIIGGSGFLGGALIRQLLEAGQSVVNFDLRAPAPDAIKGQVEFVQGDVTRLGDLERLELGPGDVVHHLAARQFGGPVPTTSRDAWFNAVNIVGTRNVVDAMVAGRCRRMVFFSTDMTYGKPTSIPVLPSHTQMPLGPYGRSKFGAEKIIREAKAIQGTVFRPRLITGPGRLGILGKLFSLIRTGLPVPLIGNGATRYQMVGVEDCARAAMLAVEADCPPGPFNLGSEHPTTRELLVGVIDHARSRSPLLSTPASLVKLVLRGLDLAGWTLMFPEQFEIADIDILLDTTSTHIELGWRPSHEDLEMMNAAYDTFVAASTMA